MRAKWAQDSLILDASGQLSFIPSTNGVSNKITGAGSATLNGTLFFRIGSTEITNGNSWTIVDAASVTSNLAGVASFPALSWNESPSGVWKAADGSNTWTYTESTGTLGLAVSAGVTYESWAITNGISGAAFTDDSDNDGIDNGTEYGIGGNPTSFTASAALVPAGSDYTLTYNKGTEAAADPQIDYAFETSPDLGIWTEVAPTAEDGTSVSYTLVKSGPERHWGHGKSSSLISAELVDSEGMPTERFVPGTPLRLRVVLEASGNRGMSLEAILRDQNNLPVGFYSSAVFNQVPLPAEA